MCMTDNSYVVDEKRLLKRIDEAVLRSRLRAGLRCSLHDLKKRDVFLVDL